MIRPEILARTAACPASVDVVIAGAGIGGTLAATALGRAGYRVCLIDRHASYPADFKAEHLDGPQIGQLIRLGFLSELTAGLYRGETVTLARSGRIVGSAVTINYGLTYEDLVNRARANLPDNVHVVVGRIDRIENSPTIQRVRLSGGQTFSGRLLIMATGSGFALGRQVGIQRQMVRERHSVTFGLDIESAGATGFEHSFVVYKPENIADRIDYLAAFVLGDTMRVNLFTYRDIRDEWTSALLADPESGLARALPGLQSVIGPYRVAGSAIARPVDLYTSEHYRRDGIVLVGDAFQSTCPATGMGIVKVLTDIEQLVTVHIPNWFATPGMSSRKIGQFYDDPVKLACDSKAMHDSEYRRALSTEEGFRWRVHRYRVRAMERAHVWCAYLGVVEQPRVAEPEPIPG